MRTVSIHVASVDRFTWGARIRLEARSPQEVFIEREADIDSLISILATPNFSLRTSLKEVTHDLFEEREESLKREIENLKSELHFAREENKLLRAQIAELNKTVYVAGGRR